MSLREQAEADLRVILNDDVTGFAWPITITDPDEQVGSLKGFSDDIAQLIDPDTGQAVSGRLASIAISVSDLFAAGLALPEAIADSTKKPWIVEFKDITLNSYKFKVSESNPDRALGLIICLLEVYE